jgi:hypothetical protein
MTKYLSLRATAAALLGACLLSTAFAADDATPADAQERLKGMVGLVKAKGVQGAAEELMSAADPLKCKYKDLTCILISDAGKFTANTSQPALIGNSLPMDMKDPDGKPILTLMVGPMKEGKTKWDAKYKFVRPGTKTIQPRWAFCEKVADSMIACTVIAQPS